MNKVIVVTSPDDVLVDGLRIILAGLTTDQQHIVSEALIQLDIDSTIIVYTWNPADNDWSIDKKHKSDIIFFNADWEDILVGYLAAQPNSHYFGTLKALGKVNTSVVYDTEQVSSIIQTALNNTVF